MNQFLHVPVVTVLFQLSKILPDVSSHQISDSRLFITWRKESFCRASPDVRSVSRLRPLRLFSPTVHWITYYTHFTCSGCALTLTTRFCSIFLLSLSFPYFPHHSLQLYPPVIQIEKTTHSTPTHKRRTSQSCSLVFVAIASASIVSLYNVEGLMKTLSCVYPHLEKHGFIVFRPTILVIVSKNSAQRI